ncbi:MAG: hypothetical protein WD036_07080 [Bauldia sp.]
MSNQIARNGRPDESKAARRGWMIRLGLGLISFAAAGLVLASAQAAEIPGQSQATPS